MHQNAYVKNPRLSASALLLLPQTSLSISSSKISLSFCFSCNQLFKFSKWQTLPSSLNPSSPDLSCPAIEFICQFPYNRLHQKLHLRSSFCHPPIPSMFLQVF